MTEQQRAVALTWVGRGLPVVPCSRTDKGALVPGFGKDKTDTDMAPFSDPEQVSQWWSSGRFARAHVGLLTGRGGPTGRGLLVIDCDMLKADAVLPERFAGVASGVDVLEAIAAAACAEWPETYTVVTPSGGVHLYFWQPTDGPLIGCATGDGRTAPHLGPLIDVRGIGGYVIAAGSYSAAQGVAYRKTNDSPDTPQPIPGWLLELLRPAAAPAAPRREDRSARVHQLPTGDRAERYAVAALNGELEGVGSAGEGERNRRLFAAARRLGELSPTAPTVLGEIAVQDELLAAARSAGISEQEALRTIRSGWSTGSRGAGAGAA
ncbi:bifunctional DNA primase/polymerase (plasmid) [Streptomyces sp. NBC_01220]|uniref:bifunctional DNA primase/polymerase n=1 Tax=Streptomyces sp. NBC_01220 TaxID=2903781 RepID=UPI002F90C802|nr:bifunctional DNA primase/polymerase [Streptomyces sp. NBC_01220]WSQ49657.1 bifunctional DNA primase/polymerase [Streptomyces sp. NBC_01220]